LCCWKTGLIDGDESVVNAAHRELLEETGLRGRVTVVHPAPFCDPWKSNESSALVQMDIDECDNPNPTQSLESDETIGVFLHRSES
jgi:8-oxo-dGTP pyrophosphatase MutT (NUDIX family)